MGATQAEEEGLEPTKEWVKDLVDEIIAEEFASPDLELAWLDEDEGDPKGLEAVLEGRVKLGAVTLNEMRDALGLDPFDNAAADRPMVLTATGYVPIEANAGGEGATAAANVQREPAVQKYSADQPRVPAGNPRGGEWTNEDGGNGPSSDAPSQSGTVSHELSVAGTRYASRDTGTLTDATDAPEPKVQYAAGNEEDETTRTSTDAVVKPQEEQPVEEIGAGQGSDDAAFYSFEPYQGRGHTWMPTAVYEKYEWQEETKNVFKNWTSGQLADQRVNAWSPEHEEYNDAADEVLQRYLARNNMTSLQATPTQGREIVEEVIGSRDPRIRDADEQFRRQRADIAALRRSCEQFALSVYDLWRECEPRARSYVMKYSPDQPRVPGGNPDGGQWTSGDGDGASTNSASSSDVGPDRVSNPDMRYASLEPGSTRTDAPAIGGVPSNDTRSTPAGPIDSTGKLDAPYASGDSYDGRTKLASISASSIPADDPMHPVRFVDSVGNPVSDDQGNSLLRPADLPPERFVSAGAASHLVEYIQLYNQAVQSEMSDPGDRNEQALAGLAAKITVELGQFRQGGPLDAERVQGQYVADYHDYANVAIGLYLAAAGVKLEDGLSFANDYAGVMSQFHEPMDEVYTYLPKRDVHDVRMGYELYQSGRISLAR